MILESMLADAGLTKHQLADNLGVSIKTIYSWSTVPQYAIAYLELYTKSQKYFRFFELLKELRE